MVRILLKLLLVIMGSFLISSVTAPKEIVIEEVKEYVIVPHIRYMERIDTFYKTSNGAFKSIDDYVGFVKYIKTQSSRADRDNWAVMQAINNRMRNKNCDWCTYYNTPSINHSNSIRLMRLGRLNKGFSWNEDKDVEHFRRAVLVSFGEAEYKIADNITAFESFKVCPNRVPHLKKNLAFKLRHKFYYTY